MQNIKTLHGMYHTMTDNKCLLCIVTYLYCLCSFILRMIHMLMCIHVLHKKKTCYSIYITINSIIQIISFHNCFMLYSDKYNTTKNIYSYTYLHERRFHDYNSMYNNKNTIKEKVIYMQAVAQHKYICGLKHIANLYNITIVR